MVKKVAAFMVALAVCGAVMAQVGTTVKEGAKATGQKAKQYGDQAKAAVESQPNKATDRAKAKIHKAKAHHHARASKEAAKQIPH